MLWQNTYFGYYYYTFNKYEKASHYFLSNQKILEEVDLSTTIDPENVLKMNAYFLYTIKEYDLCITYLKEALKYTETTSENYTSFLNHLGNCYFELGSDTEALHYLNLAKDQSQKNNQNLRYAKILGDIAQIYVKNKDFKTAEKLLLEDIELSKKENDLKNTSFALIRLGKIYFNNHQISKSKKAFLKALEFIDKTPHRESYSLYVYQYLLPIAVSEKTIIDELNYRRIIDSLRPIVEYSNGPIVLQKIAWNKEKQKSLQTLVENEKELKKNSFLKWISLILCAFLLILIVYIYLFYKKNIKSQQKYFISKIEEYETEINVSENMLDSTRRKLEMFMSSLSEKDAQIKLLESELTDKVKTTPYQDFIKRQNPKEFSQSHLVNQENWLLFKKVIISEKTKYYEYLKKNFEGLTEFELSIVLLQSIDLSDEEVANTLGMNLEDVTLAKKKLIIKYNVDYDAFLNEKELI